MLIYLESVIMLLIMKADKKFLKSALK